MCGTLLRIFPGGVFTFLGPKDDFKMFMYGYYLDKKLCIYSLYDYERDGYKTVTIGGGKDLCGKV